MDADNENVTTLRDLLAHQCKAFRLMSGSSLMAEIVLKHATVEGHGVAHDLPKGPKKQCFKNAALVALRGQMTYVEGYAVLKNLMLPMLHAWLVDDKGQIIDVTWDKPWECQYLGIAFEQDVLRRELLRNEVYGILSAGDMVNLDLLRKIDGALVDEALEAARSRRLRA
jgi:hypothetical protein